MGHVARVVNKQIAGEVGLSEITLRLHRSNMMRKMGVRNVPPISSARLNSAALRA
jgi:FixJ family two-component response regulator